MKIKVHDMGIATGGVLIAILNQEDADKLDLYLGDRIVIKNKGKTATAVVDIAHKSFPSGKIGLFEEVFDKLNAKKNDFVSIDLQEKPKSIYFIRNKMDNKKLSKEEIDIIVKDIVENRLTDVELAYFTGACYANGLDIDETIALTKATVKYGERLDLGNGKIIDKHCTGGVPGNRTTMIVVPILAAAGLTIPKTSSRSISSPAGTADTMEVLAPVSIPLSKIKEVVLKTNGCIVWGGAVDLATADDKLIRVRHALSLDPEGMLLSSILAKKAAVNSTHVLIDIPIGRDAKIKNLREANNLKDKFTKIGRKLGMKVKVLITDGSEPIGRGIGPALEARDILYILKRDIRRPLDLERKSLEMATKIMKMIGIKKASQIAYEILDSGLAYEKMKEIIKAQGGDPEIDPDKIMVGRFKYDYKAKISGKLNDIDNIIISKVARIAGAPKDKGAGIYLFKHEGDFVKKNDVIFTLYAENKVKLKYALNILKKKGEVKIDGEWV